MKLINYVLDQNFCKICSNSIYYLYYWLKFLVYELLTHVTLFTSPETDLHILKLNISYSELLHFQHFIIACSKHNIVLEGKIKNLLMQAVFFGITLHQMIIFGDLGKRKIEHRKASFKHFFLLFLKKIIYFP